MPRGRYQQKQWEMRHAAILDALESLSVEQGFSDVTMDDLANDVGISKATLYQHFKSKDEMLVGLMLKHYEQYILWLNEAKEQPPLDRLIGTMRYIMEGQITPLRGMMRLGRDTMLPVLHSDHRLIEKHCQVMSLLADVVHEAQDAGQIVKDVPSDVVLSALWALSNVSMQNEASLQCDINLSNAEIYKEQMITLFVRSIKGEFQ